MNNVEYIIENLSDNEYSIILDHPEINWYPASMYPEDTRNICFENINDYNKALELLNRIA